MKLTPLILAMMLAGCASAPQTITRTETVQVAVPVPCRVEVPPKPNFYFDTVRPDADAYTAVVALLAERKQRIAYESELEAAISSCR